MDHIAISIVRTVVPYVVGLLAAQGIVLNDAALTGLTTFLTFLVSVVYYIVVRVLEQRFPQLGWLLGAPVAPKYDEKA